VRAAAVTLLGVLKPPSDTPYTPSAGATCLAPNSLRLRFCHIQLSCNRLSAISPISQFNRIEKADAYAPIEQQGAGEDHKQPLDKAPGACLLKNVKHLIGFLFQ
jgi:hypothetical protein